MNVLETPGPTTTFAPPAPPTAPDLIGGVGVLMAVKRNAFSAFPARCFSEPVLRYSLLDRDLVLANAPEAMRHVLVDRTDLYRRVPAGDRVLGPLLGRGLASSEGEAWRRQRKMLAPAFTPRTLPSIAEHVARCADAPTGAAEAMAGTTACPVGTAEASPAFRAGVAWVAGAASPLR